MQQWMSGFAQNGVQRIVDVTGSGQCGSVGVLGMNIVGTRVRTDIGWCPVETLGAGDLVQTFNRGPQSILRADRVILWAGGDDCPAQCACRGECHISGQSLHGPAGLFDVLHARHLDARATLVPVCL